jgi:small neutral amino acid transporter SnatA (MarC family)
MIVARQAGPDDVPPAADAVHVVGAWFHANGMTQMDDQQHPLSALLAAQPSLGEPDPGQPVGGSSAPRLAWLALVTLAAVNPFHASGLTRTTTRRARRIGAAVSLAAGVFVAAIAGPLLRATDVSAPTAAVAAGLILAMYGVADAVRPVPPPIDPGRVPWLVPVAFPALLRAGAVLVVLAVAAAHGVADGVVTALAFLVAGLVPAPSDRLAPSLARVAAAIAIIGAIDLVLHGVFAV